MSCRGCYAFRRGSRCEISRVFRQAGSAACAAFEGAVMGMLEMRPVDSGEVCCLMVAMPVAIRAQAAPVSATAEIPPSVWLRFKFSS